MIKNRYILILLTLCISLTLSGCNKTKNVNYDIDKQISLISIDKDYYPKEILNKDIQDSLIKEQTSSENIIINNSLLNNKKTTNKLPMKNLLVYPKSYFKDKTVDWFGVEWEVTPYENQQKDMVSALKLKIIYDIKDLNFATKKSKEIADKFLATYGDTIYSDNTYETNFNKLDNSVIRIISDLKDEHMYAVLNIGIATNDFDKVKTPYLEIVFVHKDNLHDVADNELADIIQYMDVCLKSVGIKPPFKTIKLDAYNGYIVNDPKSDKDKTPEENLNSGTIFYN